ncbi:MAG: XdhC family protein, partial [Thermoanaerobaculia bacterium]
MREVLPEIARWRAEGKPVALATVIETWGSAPRAVGAKMAMTADGRIAGSVSGGCVESAVFEAGREALASGRPRLLHFGVTDDRAWEVGLACGGKIEVFVEPLPEGIFEPLSRELSAERPCALATVVRGPDQLLGRTRLRLQDGNCSGSLGRELDPRADAASAEALREGRSRRVALEAPTEAPGELFIEVLRPSPTLVVVGGVHIAVALTDLARAMGYRTIVVDPRQAFGNQRRFPSVDRLLSAWPDEGLRQAGLNSSAAVAVLTHDPKLDDPALREALRSDAFYVGALGSQRTQEKRRKRLLEEGMTEQELARLHAPIGLPLGGRTPEEIALSVMAQIVAVRNST